MLDDFDVRTRLSVVTIARLLALGKRKQSPKSLVQLPSRSLISCPTRPVSHPQNAQHPRMQQPAQQPDRQAQDVRHASSRLPFRLISRPGAAWKSSQAVDYVFEADRTMDS